MSTIEFEPFPKIPRLNRNITITEKIDGTNAAIVIVERDDEDESGHPAPTWYDNTHAVFAQSRNRFITPGKSTDNYGFAGWVRDNAEALVATLGPGCHFGEWWGSGIQRGYGLRGGDKRFSLFNTARWCLGEPNNAILESGAPGLGVVPVLYEGPFDQGEIDERIERLRYAGSEAAPGFDRPEGVVVYHHALRSFFKVTLEGDEAPKGAAGHALDIEKTAA